MSDTKQIFSPAQRSLLADVLNRIIPPNDKLPGAGNLGVTDFVEAAAAANPRLTRLFNEGLTQISITAVGTAGQDSSQAFGGLSSTAKDELLREIETAHPLFFEQLILQTYNGYYTNPAVFELIGYQLPKPAPPGTHPELLDVSLLDQQRKRAPFWKKV